MINDQKNDAKHEKQICLPMYANCLKKYSQKPS